MEQPQLHICLEDPGQTKVAHFECENSFPPRIVQDETCAGVARSMFDERRALFFPEM